MLTKKLACPACGVHLKVADTLPAGKMIKCPKCSRGFPVPEPDEDEPLKVEPEPEKKERDLPFSESTARKTTGAKRRKATRPPDDEEAADGGEKPRRNTKKRRKRQEQTSSKTPLIVGLVIGAVVLIGAGVAFMAWRSAANKNATLAQNNSSSSAPRMAAADAGRPRPPRRRPEMPPPEPDIPKPQAEPAPSAPTQVAVVSDRSGNGQAIFEAQCIRCHRSGGGGPGRGRGGRGPDLSRIGAKHPVDWLQEHIRDPRSHNPNSRMPGFEEKLSQEELRSVAEYLASLK
jgi:mono/diheme cytochrome c family protein